MEEDLKVKATELEDIEEVWLLHDVIMVLCWPLPQEYFYSRSDRRGRCSVIQAISKSLRTDITVRMCTSQSMRRENLNRQDTRSYARWSIAD